MKVLGCHLILLPKIFLKGQYFVGIIVNDKEVTVGLNKKQMVWSRDNSRKESIKIQPISLEKLNMPSIASNLVNTRPIISTTIGGEDSKKKILEIFVEERLASTSYQLIPQRFKESHDLVILNYPLETKWSSLGRPLSEGINWYNTKNVLESPYKEKLNRWEWIPHNLSWDLDLSWDLVVNTGYTLDDNFISKIDSSFQDEEYICLSKDSFNDSLNFKILKTFLNSSDSDKMSITIDLNKIRDFEMIYGIESKNQVSPPIILKSFGNNGNYYLTGVCGDKLVLDSRVN